MRINPVDIQNERLIANVRPKDWKNPTPKRVYDLVVIGAGTAGLVTAAGASSFGAKVALVEKSLMGGDCLNVGCVPSKAIIRASRFAHNYTKFNDFGLNSSKEADIDFSKIMERMRKLRADISSDDSAKRFSKMDVDVFLGNAKFVGLNSIEVSNLKLKFKKAVIASGSSPAIPPIAGLKDTNYHTNETIFELSEIPKTLGVIGGGPIGCEMGQAFQRLGAKVTLFQNSKHILNKEDLEASKIIEKKLKADGVNIIYDSNINKVVQEGAQKKIYYKINGVEKDIFVDEILVSVGRVPNVKGLNLEKAKVKYNKNGIEIDDFLKTSNSKIFAAGDVCLKNKFTHVADFAARSVIQNALFAIGPFGKKRVSKFLVPRVTYTSPEIAHVGLSVSPDDKSVQTFAKKMSDVHRAILDGETDGFVKVHVDKKTGVILGGTIVAEHAGEMIGELAIAISQKMKISKLASVIHPYPTQAEAIRIVGDLYNRTRLTDSVKKLLKLVMKFNLR